MSGGSHPDPAINALAPLVIALDAYEPRLGDEVFVAPGAMVVGRVTIGSRSSIWYGSVIRADSAEISIGANCNVQDGSILHSDPGDPVVIGDRVTVGHRAVIHGARLESDVLVGIGAIVLNRARVGSGSLVAAGAVVTPGTEIPPGSLVVGVPANVRRLVNDRERATIAETPAEYVGRARMHRKNLTLLAQGARSTSIVEEMRGSECQQ
jgi:carbonic anhydrase/acetyltransferase-like protein (isoleucine patch superfamily)